MLRQILPCIMVLGISIIPNLGFTQVYPEVKIGNQVWMTKNLNVSVFRNGDSIQEAKTDEEWRRAEEDKQPAWCYYENDSANGVKYGKLYNWFAVNDTRGLAPMGWHIASHEEWTVLTDYLGDGGTAAKKMKSTHGWAENSNGTNESGFSGLPGGCRYFLGAFSGIDSSCHWWSSTDSDSLSAWNCNLVAYIVYRSMYALHSTIYGAHMAKGDGFYIRCIKD